MKNPWTKKNPFMSMWLSGANSVMNRARGQATAAGRREATAIAARGMGDVLDFWAKAGEKAAPAATAKRTAAKTATKARPATAKKSSVTKRRSR